MRIDEKGDECPSTLGEYYDICFAINPDSRAVDFLKWKIEKNPSGRDDVVIASDSQMRILLMPMLAEPKIEGEWNEPSIGDT